MADPLFDKGSSIPRWDFDERWLQPNGIVPIDMHTTSALLGEVRRLRALPSARATNLRFLGTFFGLKVYEDPTLKEGEIRVQNDGQITNEMLDAEKAAGMGPEWLRSTEAANVLRADALDALVELVRLKRIKERMEQTGVPGGPNNAELTDLETDYKGSKAAAWDYAKSIVDDVPAPRNAGKQQAWPNPDDWNFVCPKCGANPDGECGWPKACPTGLAARSHGKDMP